MAARVGADGSRLSPPTTTPKAGLTAWVVVDVGGWVLAEITPGNVFGPVLASRQPKLAYSADDVFMADIEGGTRRLTDHDTFDTITCLVPSPAGDQLASRTGNGVFVMNTDGTHHRSAYNKRLRCSSGILNTSSTISAGSLRRSRIASGTTSGHSVRRASAVCQQRRSTTHPRCANVCLLH